MTDREPLSTPLPVPEPGNGFEQDWVLRAWLESTLPADLLASEQPVLHELGARSGGEWYRLHRADRVHEPRLVQWDPWGLRVDHIELTEVWKRAHGWAAEYGLVACGYDAALAEHARTVQFARAWLYIPSTDFYGCPLAMTDGAARILTDAGNAALAERALPHLLARDPDRFWTSGQWMTETAGGSDVGNTETVARRDADGRWRLTGRKWFTSAATSEIALTLARPEGAPEGSRGLALFYIEPRDDQGRLRDIEVLRLKDKLGTRKLPTAELWLDGAQAEPVRGLERGVANIAPMLNLTRTWNAVTACALARRGIDLARAYAEQRRAFGRVLARQPLHRRTLAAMEADQAAAAIGTLAMIAELGRVEAATDDARPDLLRLLTPLLKLGTAKDAIALASETLECFGGAGYVEDTGLPELLRDVQVLSIWEGTTNVLSLDLLRAIGQVGVAPLTEAVADRARALDGEPLAPVRRALEQALERVPAWLDAGDERLEAAGRELALNLYRMFCLAELATVARRRLADDDGRPLAAARLFAARHFPLREPVGEDCGAVLGDF